MPTQYAYTLTFSDPSKTSVIVVPSASNGSGKNDYSTSLELVGSGYIGYGNSVAQNFVKLLENFASPVPPAHSIEGQLWYDTSNPSRKILRVNNGEVSSARWPSANGIYQQSTDPAKDYLQEVQDGDMWVDTYANQLRIRAGGEWTLVGPSTSATENKSGVEVANLESTAGSTSTVILNWVDGKVVEIISYDTFTPRLVIDGFPTIVSGVNLTNKVSAKFNGLADRANSLEVSRGVLIKATEVLRNKIPASTRQVHTGTLVVESINGFVVKRNSASTTPELVLKSDTTDATVFFSSSTMKVGIASGISNLSYIAFNHNGKVGINTTASALVSSYPTLTVNGGAQFSNAVTISTSTTNGIVLTVGAGATIAGRLSVAGNLSVAGKTTASSTLTTVDILASTSTAVIGSTSTPYDYIFARHIGTSTGAPVSIHGIVTTATNLQSLRSFRIEGVVSTTNASLFNGSQNVVFTATAHRSLITSLASTATTATSLTLMVLNTGTANAPLQSISRSDFLADIYANIFVTGMMLPYPGTTAPAGWLFCTSTSTGYTGTVEVSITSYQGLYNVIGNRYSSSATLAGNFQLPTVWTSGTNTGTVIPYIIKT